MHALSRQIYAPSIKGRLLIYAWIYKYISDLMNSFSGIRDVNWIKESEKYFLSFWTKDVNWKSGPTDYTRTQGQDRINYTCIYIYMKKSWRSVWLKKSPLRHTCDWKSHPYVTLVRRGMLYIAYIYPYTYPQDIYMMLFYSRYVPSQPDLRKYVGRHSWCRVEAP